jgi:hypothetical protein
MSPRRTRKATALVAPALGPNEQVLAVGVGSASATPIAKRIATQIAVATATAILTGGYAVATMHLQNTFIVMTTERLIMLEPSAFWGGPTAKIVGQIQRATIVGVSDLRGIGPSTSFDLTINGMDNGIRLSFPAMSRTPAKKIVAELAGVTIVNQG